MLFTSNYLSYIPCSLISTYDCSPTNKPFYHYNKFYHNINATNINKTLEIYCTLDDNQFLTDNEIMNINMRCERF